MPVVFDTLSTVIPVVLLLETPFEAVELTPSCVWIVPPLEVPPGRLCVWPGSVTFAVWSWPGSVMVIVWLWLTNVALAEPPVAATA